jgi:hypothetical protein
MHPFPLAPKRALLALAGLSLGFAVLWWSGSVRAASYILQVPPFPPKTYEYSVCTGFTWSGNTLTCVTSGSPPPPPPPPQTPSSGTPFEGCPADALKIDGQWGNTAISTFDFGYFSSNILSIRIQVPNDATGDRIRTSSWVAFGAGQVAREAILTTAACDFSNTYALKTSSGGAAHFYPGSTAFSFRYTFGNPTLTAVKFEPGKVYYINARNRYADGSLSCFLESCSMRGGLPP